MIVYYVEYNNGWEIKEIDINNLRYANYCAFCSGLNKVRIGKWFDGKFSTITIRLDEFFRTKEDAKAYIDKVYNNAVTLQELLHEFKTGGIA